jgi:nitrogen fixation/metabolism regulation signal transduction histidine kinase
MRAFHALRVLLDDLPPELESMSLTTTIEHTLAGFEEELRAADSRFDVDLGATPIRIRADPTQFALAIQACVGTLISLIEASGRGGAIRVSARAADGSMCCEMQQNTYRLSADHFTRLTDLEWSERPGGIPAGIALAAASRIAQAHGGVLDARRTESGCALILTLRS